MTLYEREGQLETLATLWSRAGGGRGSLALVTGEAGAGKTSVVRALVDGLSPAPDTLWGTCDPLTTPRPLGPLHDIAPELSPRAAAMLRDDGQPHEIFDAVVDELRSAPRLLVVEDLHWADQATIDLLRFVLRRVATTPSMVIGTVREDEVGAGHPLRSLLGDVARSPDAELVGLEPLSLAGVAALVGERPLDPVALRRATGGNPFFVTEMLDHDGDEVPGTVREAILARTAGLDDDARDLLDLLACCPEAIPDRVLPSLGIGVGPLRACAEAGLIERSRRRVVFRHDLCRRAIVDAIPPGGEVTHHRRMLDALDPSTTDTAILVHHAVGADDPGAILEHASRAGHHASRSGAHRQAAAFYAIALEDGAPTTPEEEAELLELLAGELYLADQLPDAIAACERARTLRESFDDAPGLSADHEALSIYEWYNANRSVAEEHAARAIQAVADDRTGPHFGHAHAMEAYLAVQQSDVGRARAGAERARSVAEVVDDRRLSVRVAILDGICDILEQGAPARGRILDVLVSATEAFDEVYSSGYSNLAYLDTEQRRLREAAQVLDVSIPLTFERDVPICRVWQLGTRGRLHLLGGDWDAAVVDAEAVLDDPSAPLTRTWPHLVRGVVAMRRGEGGDDDLDEAWTLAERYDEPIRLLPIAAALAERWWLTGVADTRVDRAAAVVDRPGLVGIEWGWRELAAWLHRLGRPVDPSAPVAEPYRLQLAGDHALAAAAWADLAVPYEHALALVDADTDESVRQGLDELDRLGADAVAAKVRQDLRDRGRTAVPARRRSSTVSNPAGLTARQVEVLALLAEGLTNAEVAARLYISPKTADHHVSAILAKLGVGTRREAVREAEALGLIDRPSA